MMCRCYMGEKKQKNNIALDLVGKKTHQDQEQKKTRSGLLTELCDCPTRNVNFKLAFWLTDPLGSWDCAGHMID